MSDDVLRVLVVDDEPKICELLQALLTKEGYLVETVLDGPAALIKLGGVKYDLVLSDLKMPGMDGFELARRVKGIDDEMPLVVITGYATIDTAIQALRQGVDDYVTKPFKVDELRKVVARVLAKARLAMENRRLMAQLEGANAELRRHREALRMKVRLANESLRSANRALRQRIQELEMLREVGTCTAYEFDLDRLLGTCARLVAEELGARRASIILREGDWLTVRGCYGGEPDRLLGIRKRLGEGVAGEVARTCKPVLVQDIASDPRFCQHADRGYVTASLVCAPIIYKKLNLGVICVTDKHSGRPFADSDMRLLSTIASQMAPAIENARLYKQLEESTLSTVRALVAGLEAKDPYLRGHAQRVTQHALAIARGMNVPEHEMLVIERAGQLHDLGKMGISDRILTKPAPLTRDEYEAVKQHPVLGEQIIQPLRFLDEVRPVIRHHHERPDRTGYPDGLGGDETNLPAKIIAVADAFDAMTSPRPYRPAKQAVDACREIASLRNIQFDPNAADLFCERIIPLRLAERQQDERQRAG